MNDTLRTKRYLESVGAIYTHKNVKVLHINFYKLEAIVGSRRYYTKRNSKVCYVDKLIRKVSFDKSDIRYTSEPNKTYESTLYGLSEVTYRNIKKYLTKETLKDIKERYLQIFKY